MLIYHASKQIVDFPEIRKTKSTKDFSWGFITRKQFWALAEFKHPTHQVSFHTLSALTCLKFVKCEIMHG